ncbi:MAG: carboxypeptidase regulatory-like domain-containing protein [Acidobacteriota bacterium]
MTALLLGSLAIPAAAQSSGISGVITNKTTNKPAAGEEVSLLALTQGMEEVATVKTDGAGHYRFDKVDGGMHLVRVEHQKASYYASVPAGTSKVDLGVYDVAAKLSGITTKAQMLRIETDQQQLHVVQSYIVANDSVPARTEFGAEGYSIYIPADAKIDASEATGPGGMAISSAPEAAGDKGHYTFAFPLRPGETRFEVSYHLPYSGSFSFGARDSLATANLAIAVAHGITFKPGKDAGFQPLNDEADAQGFLMRDLKPLQMVAFSVSGSGSFPRQAQEQEQGQAAGPADGTTAAATPVDNRPGMGLGPPSGDPGPMDKYKWWILGVLAFVLVGVAGVMLRPRTGAGPTLPTLPAVAATGAPVTKGSVLDVLRDELFTLETERLRGKVTEADYTARKAALGLVLQHALERQVGSQS